MKLSNCSARLLDWELSFQCTQYVSSWLSTIKFVKFVPGCSEEEEVRIPRVPRIPKKIKSTTPIGINMVKLGEFIFPVA